MGWLGSGGVVTVIVHGLCGLCMLVGPSIFSCGPKSLVVPLVIGDDQCSHNSMSVVVVSDLVIGHSGRHMTLWHSGSASFNLHNHNQEIIRFS